MSEGGEQLIRDVWRRWNAGERPLEDRIVDPEIEIHSALTGAVFSGVEGVRQWIAEIDEQFESWQVSLEELREFGPDCYVGRGSVRARGRHSGVDLEQPVEWRIELRDGRFLRFENSLVGGPEGTA